MDLQQKLAILADAAKYDASCASSGNSTGVGICHSFTPDGRCVSLLKILLTNYCIYDCRYCVNRATSDTPRARFTVDEVVRLTIDFYRRNYIEGLFLSSGVIQDSDYTMEQMIAVARRLRQEQQFRGYIHLKTIPNANDDLIAEAGRWADRLSVNIELPTAPDLHHLAPEKKWPELHASMESIHRRVIDAKAERKQRRRAPAFAPAGQSTQMIVGATPTPDREVLHTADTLYHHYRLRRVYYSAYSPTQHADARLPAQSPPLVREHRLYQADWLLRFYGFRVEELTPEHAPNLKLNLDPKLAWAIEHRHAFPVDVNRAEREMLLRVPGLGIRTVQRIVTMRRHRAIRLADLQKFRIPRRRVLPFVLTADFNPHAGRLDRLDLEDIVRTRSRQRLLFEAGEEAHRGEF
jgi:putative DNA modification/repair radical SAM protein